MGGRGLLLSVDQRNRSRCGRRIGTRGEIGRRLGHEVVAGGRGEGELVG